MLRADLAAARAAWKAEATTEAERDARRRDPSFLRTPDAAGRKIDFHALRHTYVSRVVASGASVKIAQDLARHSTPTLTIGTYAHTRLADLRGALPTMPTTTTPTATEAERVAATGTDDATAERAGQPAGQRARGSIRANASRRDDRTDAGEHDAAPKPLVFSE